ncbi:MAG: aldo/keto reductase [Betaproteobacteria bacterium]
MTLSLRAALAHSPLALGGAPLGNLFRALPDTQAIALVQRAWDAGVRYFDTAPHYGNGRSETRFGMALSNVPRDSFVLSTKVGRLLRPDAQAPLDQHGYVDVPKFVQAYDYSRDGVLRSLADSQRRMQLDRIDIAYVHDLDQATHGTEFERHFRALLDSGLPALAELKEAGIIGGYGIGVNGVAISLQTLRHADIDVILLAGRYTLADQSALPELLPECQRRDIAVVLGGPFNSGILATGVAGATGQPPYFDYAPATANVVARVAAIETVCRRHAVPLAAAALQFPLGHPAIAVVLAGACSCAEFDTDVALIRHAIPLAFWAELRERGLIAADAPFATSR